MSVATLRATLRNVERNNAQRDEIIARAVEVGASDAAKEFGVNPSTVRSWLRREGLTPTIDQRTKRAAAITLTVAERKARLADDLLDDAQRLRAQLFAPTVERKPMNVSDGALGSHVEIVDVDLSHPSFTDQRAIMTSIAIAVDKIQILTGEATERIETLTGRSLEADALQVVDELAARRAS